MNKGGVTIFWCYGEENSPACRPGPACQMDHIFPCQLIKQPYLHPSLGHEPNNGSSQGAHRQAFLMPPTDFPWGSLGQWYPMFLACAISFILIISLLCRNTVHLIICIWNCVSHKPFPMNITNYNTHNGLTRKTVYWEPLIIFMSLSHVRAKCNFVPSQRQNVSIFNKKQSFKSSAMVAVMQVCTLAQWYFELNANISMLTCSEWQC